MSKRKRTDLIVVHVTATPPDRDIGVKEVRQMHLARGWRDVGYHEIIRRNGIIEKGRPGDEIGAHVAGFNSISYGISLVGGVDARGNAENNMTEAQFAALENRLRELVKQYPNAKICGHRDLSPDGDGDGIIESHEWLKECPCFDAIPWARRRGLPPADILGEWSDDKGHVEGPDTRKAYLQRLLARAGYEFGPIDGMIGPKTKAAISEYQTDKGLKVTGAFNAETVAMLRATFESEPQWSTPAEEQPKAAPPAKPAKRQTSFIAGIINAIVRALFGGKA